VKKTSSASTQATLLVTCEDRPGLVAALSHVLYSLGLNIVDAAQHTDPFARLFFQRIRFDLAASATGALIDEKTLRDALREVADRYAMTWSLRFDRDVQRMAIFVSKTTTASTTCCCAIAPASCAARSR
jgi:formyltetrahydrofolate deformylase